MAATGRGNGFNGTALFMDAKGTFCANHRMSWPNTKDVVRSGVTPGDLRQVPTANFVVRYAAQQTGGQLNGLVACELSPRTHGVDQWWVLLE